MNRKPSFIVLSGAFLIGLAFAWAFYTPRTLAAGQIQPLTQIEADTQICPLSDKQQEDSIQKFAEMMPTFTHPRCINCHGAINPFAPNTTHVGGRIGTKFKEIIRHDDVLGKDLTIVVIDEDEFFTRCKDCHSAFTGSRGWSMPRPQLWFIGKTSTQLCKQMKLNFSPLSSFVNHLDKDDLLFIQEAFRGTRGLDENGKAAYLNETGKEFEPEVPPISHEAFVAQGRAWVEAMGPGAAENIKGGYTCGCQPHHYVLKGNFDEVWTKDEGALHFKGQGELQIPIQFNDDGSFNGETTIDVAETNTFTLSVMSCSENISYSGVTWKANGTIDGGGEMHVTFTVQFPPSEITDVCTAGGITTTNSLPNIRPEQNMDFSAFVAVGDTFTVEDPYPEGGSLKAQFTIIEEGK
jgi:hypothetical protein